MSKTKFLTIVVIGLILLNIAVISFFLMRKGPPPRQAIRKTIIERLHFDSNQVSDYEVLIEKHRTGIQQKESDLVESKKQLYLLLQGNDYSKKDSLIHQICLRK
jgi:periplasmic protein CpxP/Spy